MLENCDNFGKKKKVKAETLKILLEKAWKKRGKLKKSLVFFFFLKTRWLILKNNGHRWEEYIYIYIYIYFLKGKHNC